MIFCLFFHNIFPEAIDNLLLNFISENVKKQMAKLLSMCVGTDPAALWIYSFWIYLPLCRKLQVKILHWKVVTLNVSFKWSRVFHKFLTDSTQINDTRKILLKKTFFLSPLFLKTDWQNASSSAYLVIRAQKSYVRETESRCFFFKDPVPHTCPNCLDNATFCSWKELVNIVLQTAILIPGMARPLGCHVKKLKKTNILCWEL